MPSLFDVQMRENELLNPNARSYREVGTPEFERELGAMVQSRKGDQFTPSLEQFGLLGNPQVMSGPQALMSNASFAPQGVDQFTPTPDQFASLGFQGVGQDLVQNPQDTFTPKPEEFNALGFDSVGGSQEELMQQASDTMSSIKQGDLSNPQAAAQAAQVVKEDASTKGASINIEKPEGMEASAWESFNDQFDLTTIGLTLLATNSNGQNLAANLGYAMQAGRAAKTKASDREDTKALLALDKEAKKQQKDFENSVKAEDLRIKQAKLALDREKASKVTGATVKPFNLDNIKSTIDTLLTSGVTGTNLDPDNETHRTLVRNTGNSLNEISAAYANKGIVLTPNDQSVIFSKAFNSPAVLGNGTLDFGKPDVNNDLIKSLASNPKTIAAYKEHMNKVAASYVKQYK